MSTRTVGAGMVTSPKLALQEAIVVGLHTLASDQRAIDELVGYDSGLRHSSKDGWRKGLRAALVDMLDPSSDTYVDVLASYPVPWGQARLPCVSIVTQSGGENSSELVAGNLLRVYGEMHGPLQQVYRVEEYGMGQRHTLEVAMWAVEPERSELMLSAVKSALLMQTVWLAEQGVHELSLQEGELEPNPALEPRVNAIPAMSVSMSWTFRQSERRLAQNRIRFLPGTFTSGGS